MLINTDFICKQHVYSLHDTVVVSDLAPVQCCGVLKGSMPCLQVHVLALPFTVNQHKLARHSSRCNAPIICNDYSPPTGIAGLTTFQCPGISLTLMVIYSPALSIAL